MNNRAVIVMTYETEQRSRLSHGTTASDQADEKDQRTDADQQVANVMEGGHELRIVREQSE